MKEEYTDAAVRKAYEEKLRMEHEGEKSRNV
jgi:hypothetical protein